MYKMEELKRAHEMRIDEFSRNELRDSHDTIQQLTSQKQEGQERVSCVSDSRESQENRLALENFHTFPVNRQSFQVLVEC